MFGIAFTEGKCKSQYHQQSKIPFSKYQNLNPDFHEENTGALWDIQSHSLCDSISTRHAFNCNGFPDGQPRINQPRTTKFTDLFARLLKKGQLHVLTCMDYVFALNYTKKKVSY